MVNYTYRSGDSFLHCCIPKPGPKVPGFRQLNISWDPCNGPHHPPLGIRTCRYVEPRISWILGKHRFPKWIFEDNGKQEHTYFNLLVLGL